MEAFRREEVSDDVAITHPRDGHRSSEECRGTRTVVKAAAIASSQIDEVHAMELEPMTPKRYPSISGIDVSSDFKSHNEVVVNCIEWKHRQDFLLNY